VVDLVLNSRDHRSFIFVSFWY